MFFIILGIGFLLGWLASSVYSNKVKSKLSQQIASLESQLNSQATLKDSVGADLKSVTQGVIQESQSHLAKLLTPLNDTLKRYQDQYSRFETNRNQVYGALQSEIKAVADSG